MVYPSALFLSIYARHCEPAAVSAQTICSHHCVWLVSARIISQKSNVRAVILDAFERAFEVAHQVRVLISAEREHPCCSGVCEIFYTMDATMVLVLSELGLEMY